MIPDAAIEAAHKAWRAQAALDGSIFEYNLRAAIEAAYPHMLTETADDALRAAWDRGYSTGQDGMTPALAEAWEAGASEAWARSTPEVNGAAYQWRHEGEPTNPYRPTP